MTIPSTTIGGSAHPYELLRLGAGGLIPTLALTAKLKSIEDLSALTAAGLALLDDADAPAQRTTLGLGTAATHAHGDYDAAGAAAAAQSAAEDYADGLDATAEHTANKGQANGYASLDGSGKVPSAQLPAAVVGAMSYQSAWDADANSPDITAAPAKGQFWIVDTDGATNLSGITDWKIGDWAVYDGAAWSKIDNSDRVTSVAGKIGNVTLDVSDVTDAEDVNNKDQADGYAGLNGSGRLTANVRDGSIATAHIAATAVTTAKIEDRAVTADKIALGVVTFDHLADGTVVTGKIGDNAVTAEKLADNAVDTGAMQDESVTTAKLYAEAVTTGKIAPNAINASKIADTAITTNKIAAYNVTESRLADGAVNTRVLADDAVGTAKIADEAVTAAKTSSAIALVDGSRAFTGPITTAGMKRAVSIKTADFTLGNTDDIVLINAADDDIAGELPAATGSGREYRVGRIDNAGEAHDAKVTRTGTDTIVSQPGANATDVTFYIKGESTCFVDVAAGIWFAF